MNYTNILNGFTINGSSLITGITSSEVLSNNIYTFSTNSIIKTYYDGGFLSANTSYYTQNQLNSNFVSATTSNFYTKVQSNANFLVKQKTMSFTSLGVGIPANNIYSIATPPDGSVYINVYNGTIYKQTGGTGNFFVVDANNRGWYDLTYDRNGDIYATVYSTPGQGIWKQTGGTGNFFQILSDAQVWIPIACAPNGDIYAAVYNASTGAIYKQTGGVGSFNLVQSINNVIGMCADPFGNIYASVYNVGLYKQTGYTGNFFLIDSTVATARALCSDDYGNIYTCVVGGDIYKRSVSGGNYVAQGQTSRNWLGMSWSSYYNTVFSTVYTSTAGVYKNTFTDIPLTYTPTQSNTNFLSANTFAYGGLTLAGTSFNHTTGNATALVVGRSNITANPTKLTSVSNSTGYITGLTSGTYLISFSLMTSSTSLNMYIYKNGISGTLLATCSSGKQFLNGDIITSLSVGNTIGIYTRAGGATVTVYSYSLTLVKIGT